jgi:hypothetical protein
VNFLLISIQQPFAQQTTWARTWAFTRLRHSLQCSHRHPKFKQRLLPHQCIEEPFFAHPSKGRRNAYTAQCPCGWPYILYCFSTLLILPRHLNGAFYLLRCLSKLKCLQHVTIVKWLIGNFPSAIQASISFAKSMEDFSEACTKLQKAGESWHKKSVSKKHDRSSWEPKASIGILERPLQNPTVHTD